MTMGVGTFLIGCLPTYDQVGVGAVAILCLLRFIQGIGLGGEWSGAALVATENAPEDKRALYGSLPGARCPDRLLPVQRHLLRARILQQSGRDAGLGLACAVPAVRHPGDRRPRGSAFTWETLIFRMAQGRRRSSSPR